MRFLLAVTNTTRYCEARRASEAAVDKWGERAIRWRKYNSEDGKKCGKQHRVKVKWLVISGNRDIRHVVHTGCDSRRNMGMTRFLVLHCSCYLGHSLVSLCRGMLTASFVTLTEVACHGTAA